jgi:hypothetical protein
MSPRITQRLVILVAATFCVGSFARSADACLGGVVRFEDVFEQADVVLRASVTGIADVQRLGTKGSNGIPLFGEKQASLDVREVWKGRPPTPALLIYTEINTACGFDLHPGETITLFGFADSNGTLYAQWQQVAERSNFVLNQSFLEDYRRRTNTLRTAAQNGGKDEGFAFARHLTRWNASEEAKSVYKSLIDKYDDDAPAYLGLAVAQEALNDRVDARKSLDLAVAADPAFRQIDPTDPVYQESILHSRYWNEGLHTGRIARAKFLLTGRLTWSWSDWAHMGAATECSLTADYITGARFTGSDLSGCEFDGGIYDKISFEQAHLANASFVNAHLTDIDFSHAQLNSTSFKNAVLKNINFSGADVGGASFENANVNVGDLVGTPEKEAAVNYLQARFDNALLSCTLDDANYINTSFNSGMRKLWIPRLQVEQKAVRSLAERSPSVRLARSCQSLIDVDLALP